ncbi:MAG: type I phosphomannose isomerase catalytic subunit [Roseibacillus sp.]
MEPITFEPIYMTRVWGGRTLEEVYGRELPDAQPYGESWEISDRIGEQSVITEGPLAGTTLHDLWTQQREEIFGAGLNGERFPLLIKILDARDDLSIQVHPPTEVAPKLGGDPKTEMWYIADAAPGAKLYLGLKDGVTKEAFEASIADGTVDQLVHAVEPEAGQSIFIPSGRLHAIGAGLLIYEIQQNSDTTYRVFDWNRVGLDGNPRELHVTESMECIDFADCEPGMDVPDGHTLASCDYFVVDQLEVPEGAALANPDSEHFSIVTVVDGQLRGSDGRSFEPGDFVLLPRGADQLEATAATVVLQTTIPE